MLQRILSAIVVTVVLLLFVFGPTPTALPHEIPDDLVIAWYEGGGMNPDSIDVSIRAGQLLRTEWKDGEKTEREASVSQKELLDLYTVLREKKADTIRTDGEDIYDGENNGYDLQWGDEYVSIWGAAVVPKDQERYAEIYGALSVFIGAAF